MTASPLLVLLALLALPYAMRLLLADLRRTAALQSVGQLELPFEPVARRCGGWVPVRVVDARCEEVRHA